MNATLTKPTTTQASSKSSESTAARRQPSVRPRADIYETSDAWLLVLDMPGADDKSTDISLEKHVLTITAEVPETTPEGFDRVHTEFLPRRFERSFRIPDDVDGTAIEATVTNGVLRVTIPKSKAAQPIQIAVKGGQSSQ